jgi:hypothetical protein
VALCLQVGAAFLLLGLLGLILDQILGFKLLYLLGLLPFALLGFFGSTSLLHFLARAFHLDILFPGFLDDLLAFRLL